MQSIAAAAGERGTAELAPLLELRNVYRTFGPIQAVRDVSFSVHKGKVLGLIGENGAGKSTLLNIVSGTDRQSAGTVLVRGDEVRFEDYYDAARHGVFRVFQELALIPNLAVWENLFLGHERLLMRAGMIRRREAIQQAREIFKKFGHGWIDVEQPVGDLPFSVQQAVEILRAFALSSLLGQDEPIILLDEPTAGLSSEEIEFLHELVRSIRAHSAVVFVSHRLTELLQWSDDVLVLKDGGIVGGAKAEDLTEDKLHLLMVGRERDVSFYRENRQRNPESEFVLKLSDFGDGSTFGGVDLTLRRGEILGIAGVLGSGKSELGRAIFGARKSTDGALEILGVDRGSSPSVRMTTEAGVGYVSPERKDDGLIDTFPVVSNISIARIATRGRRLLNLGLETQEARDFVARLRIKTASVRSPVLSLSGGNQQKVVLARWLARRVDVLILDNPTRGVDAGAKEQVYDILRDLADDGVGVLLISDDLLEVIGLSNRIIVMKDGAITNQVDAGPQSKPSEATLIATMV